MAEAFDPLAPTYDHDFTDTPIGRFLRQRVHARLLKHFSVGDHVVELGCGTGEDALFLARRGIRVTATDVSEKMLAITRAKTAHTGLVDVRRVDLRALAPEAQVGAGYISPPQETNMQVNGAFSNFGAVNVLADWRPLAGWLAERVKPSGIVALGVMGRVCAWELLWHGAHLNFKTARRRLSGKSNFQGDEASAPIDIYYPTIGRIKRDFAPHFKISHVEGLGVFLPPSDAFGVVEKRPRLLKTLTALETRFAKLPLLATIADHFWIELEREK